MADRRLGLGGVVAVGVALLLGVIARHDSDAATRPGRVPVLGRSFVVKPLQGRVFARPAPRAGYRPLRATRLLHTGATLDVTHGAARITAATPGASKVETARVEGGELTLGYRMRTAADGTKTSAGVVRETGQGCLQSNGRQVLISTRGMFGVVTRLSESFGRNAAWSVWSCDGPHDDDTSVDVTRGVVGLTVLRPINAGPLFIGKGGSAWVECHRPEGAHAKQALNCTGILQSLMSKDQPHPGKRVFAPFIYSLTNGTQYQLCVERPSDGIGGKQRCRTLPLTATMGSSLRVGSSQCVPRQVGTYTFYFSLAGDLVAVHRGDARKGEVATGTTAEACP